MSQDHQPQTDQGAGVPQNDVHTSDVVELPAPADPMQVLMQASQAAESLQSRFAELQQRQVEINGERDQLTADRTAFEDRAGEFAEQVARDRVEQRQLRSELDEETQRVKQLAQSLEERHTRLRQTQTELDVERVRLQQTMSDELASDREALQAEREALNNERAALVQQQAEQEASLEERHQQAVQQIETERECLREGIREEFNSELSQLNRERHEWKDRQQLEHDQLRDESETLQQQRELLGEQISAEQSRLRDELETRRQTLLTEQTNLQRRYRFQFDHLARARSDFDSEVRQLRRDQQSFRAERQQFQEQHRLQLVMLSRIRDLLDERDGSLKREQRVMKRRCTAVQMDLQRQQKQLQEHRDSVNHELDERTRQVSLQEGSISRSTQRLAEKTQQLNRLRAELDSQQRDLLELRIIVEEVQGDLHRQYSDADMTSRQRQARESLVSFFEELHQRIRDERQEVEQLAIELEQNRAAFRCDREELEKWFKRNAGVLEETAAEAPSEPSEEVLVLKNELDHLRSEWAADCSHSEARIRSLLEELETLQRSGFWQHPPNEAEEDSLRAAA